VARLLVPDLVGDDADGNDIAVRIAGQRRGAIGGEDVDLPRLLVIGGESRTVEFAQPV
jgi:hypothetical protein